MVGISVKKERKRSGSVGDVDMNLAFWWQLIVQGCNCILLVNLGVFNASLWHGAWTRALDGGEVIAFFVPSFPRILCFFCSAIVPCPLPKMSDGRDECKGWGATMTWETPVVVQLNSSGSMGVGRPRDQRGVASTPPTPLPHSSHPWGLMSHCIN